MEYKTDRLSMDEILAELSGDYMIYAPKWDMFKKNVRFGQIKSVREIVLDRQTDFSAKEAFYPISQIMVYFRTDDTVEERLKDERDILIFGIPCDINSIRRLDKIFYDNGLPDYYYARMREKVKFVLLECRESFEECFCVSMNSNEASPDDYIMAVRFDTDGDGDIDDIYVKVVDPELESLFEDEEEAEFTFRVAFDKPTHNGQFCMLSIPKVGEAPISISGKGDGYVEFTIRKVGRLTQGVFDLHEGGTLFLRGPYGHWWPVEEKFAGPDMNLLIISGGTGLAPVRTTLNYFYNNPDQINSLYLISGFKDVSGALFNEEREKWSKAEKFHTIYTLDNSEAPGFETGMVTVHIDKVPFESFGDNYNVAIVGPPPMMHFSALGCMKLGVPEDKIWVSFERKMQCAVGKCGHCKINETYVCLEGPVLHYPKARTLFD